MNKDNTIVKIIAAAVMAVCIVLLIIGTVFLYVTSSAKGGSSEAVASTFEGNADSYYETEAETYTYKKNFSSSTKSSTSKKQTESSIEGDTVESAENSSTDMPDSDFIFPDSQTTLITTAQMEKKLTSKDLTHRAINEIYARHGYNFQKTDREYFYSLSWYQNLTKIDSMDDVEAQFNSIEKQNVDNLADYRNSKGWN
jgi:hypothetical protein